MLIRIAYYVYRIVSSIRYRMERRFTRAGFLVLVGLVVTMALGVDLEHALAYQLYALLMVLLLLAMAAALFFRGRFDAQRFLPRYGTVGQALIYRVQVRNRGKRAFRALELLEDLADARPTLTEFTIQHAPTPRTRSFRLSKPSNRSTPNRWALTKPMPVPALPAQGTVELKGELQPLRRGTLRFRGVTLARSDPFGLFRGFVCLKLPGSVTILPRRYAVPAIALPGASKYQQGGVTLASSVGESEDFVSLRDYRPGDPLRRVHWRSFARAGKLIVKEYQDEFFVRHALVLDSFAEPDESDAFEEAISIAASLACTIATQESLLDLMFVGPRAVCFTTGRGLAHSEQALEILASVRPCADQPFQSLHDLVVGHSSALSGCICVFLDWDLPRQNLVRQLTARALPVLVLVVATADKIARLRPGADQPGAQLHFIEVGRVAEGLAALGAVARQAA